MEEARDERGWDVGRWVEEEDWQWRGWWLLEEVRNEREWYVRR